VAGLGQTLLEGERCGLVHAEEDSQIAESAELFSFRFSELDSGTRSGCPGDVKMQNSDIACLVAFPHALGQFIGNFIRVARQLNLLSCSHCLPEGRCYVAQELTHSIPAARRLAVYISLRCRDPRVPPPTKLKGLADAYLCVYQI
jgi:hypothetical protein